MLCQPLPVLLPGRRVHLCMQVMLCLARQLLILQLPPQRINHGVGQLLLGHLLPLGLLLRLWVDHDLLCSDSTPGIIDHISCIQHWTHFLECHEKQQQYDDTICARPCMWQGVVQQPILTYQVLYHREGKLKQHLGACLW